MRLSARRDPRAPVRGARPSGRARRSRRRSRAPTCRRSRRSRRRANATNDPPRRVASVRSHWSSGIQALRESGMSSYPCATDSVVGSSQQRRRSTETMLDPGRDVGRRLLGANRARLLELVVDFVQARPAGERRSSARRRRGRTRRSRPRRAPGRARRGGRAAPGRRRARGTSGRTRGLTKASPPSVERSAPPQPTSRPSRWREDQQAARRQAACDLLGRDGIVRLDAGLDRSPRLEGGLVRPRRPRRG